MENALSGTTSFFENRHVFRARSNSRPCAHWRHCKTTCVQLKDSRRISSVNSQFSKRKLAQLLPELFVPSVTVGLLKPVDLAGYRNGQVYIRKSMHAPRSSNKLFIVRPLDENFFFKLPNFPQLLKGVLQTTSKGCAFYELTEPYIG
jgi:hypothetical protein